MKNKIKRTNSSPASAFMSQFEDDINNDNVIDNNNNNNIDNDINNIINGTNDNERVQVGIYLDPEVVEALKPLSRKKKKSEFINQVLKNALKENGLL
ncbi:hypothetical protein MOD76_19710 [Bacillus spizizenii]|nr:hypothetical protein [Bacillus spizizenii]MCY8902922.1 hypothetical protein [Bacillus spizizenii]MCY8907053.1 hypothetical protein [Bacillus spizizenii]